MPGASRPDAHFRVEFDDAAFAEDLEHTSSDTGRALAQRERDKLTAEGLAPNKLKRCDTEARDGTSLPGCVKIYIPAPDGTWSSNCVSAATGGPSSPASPSARVTPLAPERSASIKSPINGYTGNHHDADRRLRADETCCVPSLTWLAHGRSSCAGCSGRNATITHDQS